MTRPMISPLIDVRLRPPFLHNFFGATPGTPEFELVRWVNRRVGSTDIDHFTSYTCVADILGGMDEAGISLGLVVGRSTPTVRVANDSVAAIVRQSAGRLAGVASVDPLHLDGAGAVEKVRRAIRDLGLVAVNFDAGFYETPMRASDERLMPLYEACASMRVPAFIMSGPTTPDLAFNDPLAIDAVARTFPGLAVVCCHGFYPNIDGMIAVAFRHENVYVSPDMYLFAPGGSRYVEAAHGFLQDQLLFGSSFPFRAMQQSAREFTSLDLPKSIRYKVAAGNAARILNLESLAWSELYGQKLLEAL